MNSFASKKISSYVANYDGLNSSSWQRIFLTFLEAVVIGVYYFLPIYFVNELKISLISSGLIVSFFGIGTILGAFLGGKLSDKFTPAIVAITTLLIQSIVFIVLPSLHNVSALEINLFFMGIASYGFITASHLWILNTCNEYTMRLKTINILNMASNLGLGISAIIISNFAKFGFKSIFYFCSILLCLLVLFFLLLERKNLNKNSEAITNQRTEPNKEDNHHKSNRKVFILSLICLFLAGLIIFQLNTTYFIYIENKFPALGVKATGDLFALNTFLVVFLQVPIGNFFSNRNKILAMGFGAFAMGIGMLALNFSYTFLLAILACVLYTFGEMIFFSVAQFLCYNNSGKSRKGHALGLYRMVYASSKILAPISGAFIYENYSSTTLWYICGLIGFLCLLACGSLKKYG